MATVHVYPVIGRENHQTDAEDAECPCGPILTPCEGRDGRLIWLVKHQNFTSECMND